MHAPVPGWHLKSSEGVAPGLKFTSEGSVCEGWSSSSTTLKNTPPTRTCFKSPVEYVRYR